MFEELDVLLEKLRAVRQELEKIKELKEQVEQMRSPWWPLYPYQPQQWQDSLTDATDRTGMKDTFIQIYPYKYRVLRGGMSSFPELDVDKKLDYDIPKTTDGRRL